MDKELELENKFIQLWNDGNSYDEIAEEIGVDIEQIRQWGTDLIIENNKLFDDKKYVLRKLEDGKYFPSNGEEFPERVLFKIEEPEKQGAKSQLRYNRPLNGIIRFEKHLGKFGVICIASGNQFRWKPIIAAFHEIEDITVDDLINKYEFQVIKLPPVLDAYPASIKELNNHEEEHNYLGISNKIVRFTFENFYGIKNIKISILPKNCQWIFLTGENGYGKSTLLKAIALGLREEIIKYQEGNFKTRLGITYMLVPYYFENEPYISFSKLHSFAAYGPHRITLQQPDAKNEIGRKSEVLYSLFNTDGILLNIEIELVFWKLENDPKFEKVKQLLISVVPDLKDIIIQGREVMYIEKSTEGESYKAVSFDELAAGYKSVIAMVGDIYLRLSKHQLAVEIKDLGGIVIIDEIDVHLHPKWQRALPDLLSKAFPKVQFIASTHSPIPFLGAPKNAVFLKVDRTPEEGITCERIDIDVTNLTPNLILSSPIFGFGDLTSINAEEISEVETEDSYGELKKNRALRDRLLEFEKSKREFPDELFERKIKTNNPTESK